MNFKMVCDYLKEICLVLEEINNEWKNFIPHSVVYYFNLVKDYVNVIKEKTLVLFDTLSLNCRDFSDETIFEMQFESLLKLNTRSDDKSLPQTSKLPIILVFFEYVSQMKETSFLLKVVSFEVKNAPSDLLIRLDSIERKIDHLVAVFEELSLKCKIDHLKHSLEKRSIDTEAEMISSDSSDNDNTKILNVSDNEKFEEIGEVKTEFQYAKPNLEDLKKMERKGKGKRKLSVDSDLSTISSDSHSSESSNYPVYRVRVCWRCGFHGHVYSQCKEKRRRFCKCCGCPGYTVNNCPNRFNHGMAPCILLVPYSKRRYSTSGKRDSYFEPIYSDVKCFNCLSTKHSFKKCRKFPKIFCHRCGLPGVRKSKSSPCINCNWPDQASQK